MTKNKYFLQNTGYKADIIKSTATKINLETVNYIDFVPYLNLEFCKGMKRHQI